MIAATASFAPTSTLSMMVATATTTTDNTDANANAPDQYRGKRTRGNREAPTDTIDAMVTGGSQHEHNGGNEIKDKDSVILAEDGNEDCMAEDCDGRVLAVVTRAALRLSMLDRFCTDTLELLLTTFTGSKRVYTPEQFNEIWPLIQRKALNKLHSNATTVSTEVATEAFSGDVDIVDSKRIMDFFHEELSNRIDRFLEGLDTIRETGFRYAALISSVCKTESAVDEDTNSPKYLMKHNFPEYLRRLDIVKKRVDECIEKQRKAPVVTDTFSVPFIGEGSTHNDENIEVTSMINICAEDSYWDKDPDCRHSGWMRMHDLKSWMKVHDLKGWLKQHSKSTVKYLFYEVVGTMKLHDLTGWLKHKLSTYSFKPLHYDTIGSMKLHDLTGWLKQFDYFITR